MGPTQPAVLGGNPRGLVRSGERTAALGSLRAGPRALPELLDVLLRHPDEEHDGVDARLDQVPGAADPGLQ